MIRRGFDNCLEDEADFVVSTTKPLGVQQNFIFKFFFFFFDKSSSSSFGSFFFFNNIGSVCLSMLHLKDFSDFDTI